MQRFGESAIALDDPTVAVALQTAVTQVLQDLRVVAHADQALLHLGATSAGTVHHHVEHARHRGAGRPRVARRLAGVLAELALLAADLPAAVGEHVVGGAGRLVAESLTEVSAGERLAAHAVAEDLLAVAGNALDDPVAAFAQAVRGDRAGRAGTEVAGVVASVAARTQLRTGLVARGRRRAAADRRRNHLLAAGTGDRLHAHVAAGNAGTAVARQVAGVLAAVEQQAADALADVEGPVGPLAAMRTAEHLALVATAVQLGLADAGADERSAQLLLFGRRETDGGRSVVERPARNGALGESATAGLRAGRFAGGTRACVAFVGTGVETAGERLAADLATAGEGIGAAAPGWIDLESEVLAAGTFGRRSDGVGTGTAVEGVADLIAAMALALQDLAAHLAAAVRADPCLSQREQRERLHVASC